MTKIYTSQAFPIGTMIFNLISTLRTELNNRYSLYVDQLHADSNYTSFTQP